MAHLKIARVELDDASTKELVAAPASAEAIHLAGLFIDGPQAVLRAELLEGGTSRALAEQNGAALTRTWRNFPGRAVRLANGVALNAHSLFGHAAGAYVHAAYWIGPGGELNRPDLEFVRLSPAGVGFEEILPVPGAGFHYRLWQAATSSHSGNHVYTFQWVGESTIRIRIGVQSGQGATLNLLPNFVDAPENTAIEVAAPLGGGANASAQLYYTVEPGRGAGP